MEWLELHEHQWTQNSEMFLAHTQWLLSHLCNDYHPHQSLIRKHFKPTKEIVCKGDAYLELKTSDLEISSVKMQQRCVFILPLRWNIFYVWYEHTTRKVHLKFQMSLLMDHFSVAHYEGCLNWLPRKAYCGDFTDLKKQSSILWLRFWGGAACRFGFICGCVSKCVIVLPFSSPSLTNTQRNPKITLKSLTVLKNGSDFRKVL